MRLFLVEQNFKRAVQFHIKPIKFCNHSSLLGSKISIAFEGVEALKSATKSLNKKSL